MIRRPIRCLVGMVPSCSCQNFCMFLGVGGGVDFLGEDAIVL